MKRIIKTYNGVVPNGKLLNSYSTSQNDGYSCDYINGLETYSTDEIRIGTWIDGKPLYRKVLNIPALKNNGTTSIQFENNIIIRMYDIYAVRFYDNAPLLMFKLNLPTNNYISTYVDYSTHLISVVTSSDRTDFTENYIILEYTKTTD